MCYFDQSDCLLLSLFCIFREPKSFSTGVYIWRVMIPLAVADQTTRHAKDTNCQYESDAYARQPCLRQTGRTFHPRGLPLRSAAFRLRKRALALHSTRISNPKGIESSSPGLRLPRRSNAKVGGTSYPGYAAPVLRNPNGVAAC